MTIAVISEFTDSTPVFLQQTCPPCTSYRYVNLTACPFASYRMLVTAFVILGDGIGISCHHQPFLPPSITATSTFCGDRMWRNCTSVAMRADRHLYDWYLCQTWVKQCLGLVKQNKTAMSIESGNLTQRHITRWSPMSSFAHVDCVSGKELSGLFDNTRHNWIVFAPMKEGAPLFDSSFLQ